MNGLPQCCQCRLSYRFGHGWRVYDASDARVARRLRRYARSQADWDRGMKPEERVARVAERYLEFVFYETLRECFMGLEAKEEESDGFLRKLLARAAE